MSQVKLDGKPVSTANLPANLKPAKLPEESLKQVQFPGGGANLHAGQINVDAVNQLAIAAQGKGGISDSIEQLPQQLPLQVLGTNVAGNNLSELEGKISDFLSDVKQNSDSPFFGEHFHMYNMAPDPGGLGTFLSVNLRATPNITKAVENIIADFCQEHSECAVKDRSLTDYNPANDPSWLRP